jgi:hypothetical protein
MLIILEGPDGVGKTTLAGKLHDVIRDADPRGTVISLRKGPPVSHPLDEYLTPLLNYKPGQGVHYILDRWHIGEYVYPRLSGRSTQLDDTTWWYLNQFIRRLGGLLVMCHTNASDVAEIYEARKTTHPFETTTAFLQAEKLFAEACDSAFLPQITYDWADRLNVSPENIVRTALVRESYVRHLSPFITYVGRQNPKYLLLGDIRHGLDRVDELLKMPSDRDRRPAFMPYRGTSGHWLVSALLTKPELQDVALANARDVDDVHALWARLGLPKVATLGNFAHREFNKPHGRAPHPQFGRRFYHKHQESYAAALLAALENQEDHSKWRGSSTGGTARTSTARSSTPSDALGVGRTLAAG